MKYKKRIKSFFFKDGIDQTLNQLDEISLKNHADIFDIVSDRYPILSKIEIAIIIKTIFETLRELLIRGCIININRFFFDFKLHFFQHNKNGEKINNAVKVKIKTPPTWKERLSWKAYKMRIKI